jgi:chromosomal replication initiator protein
VIDAVWEEFLKIVAQEAGSHVVQTWLKAVCLSQWDAFEKIVYLKAPNLFIKEWIQTNYLLLFQLHLSRLFNVDKVKVVFIDLEDEKPKKLSSVEATIIPAVAIKDFMVPSKKNNLIKRHQEKQKNIINKNYQFDTFVVGPSNQLAYAAAHAVTEKIGKLYNPLFIYGGSGLGKTHLLHAIGNEVKSKNKKAEILYQTADHFVNEFINAIRFDKVPQFKDKYTDIDVLLIDDVQFISNKEQTQEAFFHIFNTLYESHKQIVFSSDSDPAGINGLAERLRSRFEWGLVTDIQLPTTETKIAILKRKLDLNNHEISDDVIYFIASRIVSNIRELEGALIRVTAFAALTNQPITIELAKKLLLRTKEVKETAIDFNAIIKCLQKHYSYSLHDLRSQARDKQLSLVRQLAMYFMKKLTNKSLQEIGHFLGRKDHTTVMHAVTKIQSWLEVNHEFGEQIKKIEQEIVQ